MLCRVLRCLWPLGKWKMEEEAGQQHDCGVYGCCALNTCENSGIRRWGIFLFWDSVSLFLKNKSHYMFFLTELPSIGWTTNFFSLSPCPQMSDFALFSWFIFSSFVHFWRLSALCWRQNIYYSWSTDAHKCQVLRRNSAACKQGAWLSRWPEASN